MSNEWDRESNILTQEEKEATEESERQQLYARWERERMERERTRAERRAAQGFFSPNPVSDDVARQNFPRIAEWLSEDEDIYRDRFNNVAPYLVNKIWTVCHNCGYVSYKATPDISELTKCGACRSRDIHVVRGGEISLALRNSSFGVNMREVYNGRRERLRRQRTERSARRRNS